MTIQLQSYILLNLFLKYSYHFAGGLLIGRTLAVLATMTLATSMAAKEGPIPMAGHQICLQVWLAISLLTDALALSGQVKMVMIWIF